jgi:hypothetical protein
MKIEKKDLTNIKTQEIFKMYTNILNKENKLILVLVLLLFSCNNENAEKAAKDYCNCMDRNLIKSSEVVAMTICEAELVNNFYYYRIGKINLPMEENPTFQLSWEENEKARLFFNKVDSLVYRNCNLDMR